MKRTGNSNGLHLSYIFLHFYFLVEKSQLYITIVTLERVFRKLLLLLTKGKKDMSNKAEVNVICVGGCGINVGVALKANSKTEVLRDAYFIGLDASNANSSNGLFEVEYMTTAGSQATMARGSGKKRSANYDQAEEFTDKVMAKHKPADVNIIIGSTSGGSGSMLTTMVIRSLAKKGIPFVVCFVSDFTSIVERANAINTLRSTVAQTNPKVLGVPVPFIHFTNQADVTRGKMNDQIVDRLNLLSLFLTEHNEEADYEDIKNLLTYSKHYDVAPAFSQIHFYDEEAARAYSGDTPVAVYSLFEDKNSIIPRFAGTVIRTTGVFGKNTTKPADIKELHMTLDHGQYLEDLAQHIDELNEVKKEAKSTYAHKSIDIEDTDDNGVFM